MSNYKLQGFEDTDDFLQSRAGIYEHNRGIFEYINKCILEKGTEGRGAGDALANWGRYTSEDEHRNVEKIDGCYLPGAKLSPTYSDKERFDSEGRADYFTHLADDLGNLCVVFKKVKVYAQGVPGGDAKGGVFVAPDKPMAVVKYSFCGIDKDGDVKEREAAGTFSFAKDEAGNLKFADHNSTPVGDNVPEYKQALYNAVKGMMPYDTFEMASADDYGNDALVI